MSEDMIDRVIYDETVDALRISILHARELAERIAALEAEIEEMTPKFVAYEYLVSPAGEEMALEENARLLNRIAALEAEASEGERRGLERAADRIQKMQNLFKGKRDRAGLKALPRLQTQVQVLGDAAAAVRALILEAPAQGKLGSAEANQNSVSEFGKGWLAAVDALDEMAQAMDEKAETFRSPNPFDPATMEEADAATTGWVLEQAAKLLRERALIPEAPARDDWQQIETAPRDGTEIILHDRGTVGTGFYSEAPEARRAEAGWFWEDDRGNLLIAKNADPTHWMPLPSPPQDREEQ